MKPVLVVMFLLLVPGLVAAGVYWHRTQSLDAHLTRARALVGLRKTGELLERSANRFPENAELQFLCARQLGYEAKFGKADDYLQRAAILGWPRAEVDRQHWLLLLHVDFRTAEPHLQRLRDVNPDDQEVLIGLAMGYARNKHLAMAEILADRSVQNNPRDGAAYCVRGKILMQQKLRERALEDLEKALALGAGRYYEGTAQLLHVMCLRQLGRFESAYQCAIRARASDPENVLLLFNLGLCARYTNRLDEALEAYNTVLKKRPNDADTLFELAQIYEDRREFAHALEVLGSLEVSYPNDSQLLAQTSRIYQALGNAAKAEAYQQRYRVVDKRLQELSRSSSARTAPEERTSPPRPDPIE